MEDTSEIVEFDARTLKILKRFPLDPGEEPTGLAFDPKARKLFSTCANRKLVIADADSGKVVQTLEIGPGPDGCVFDAETGLIFSSSGGDGTLTIVREQSPGRYEVARTIKTQVERQDDRDGPQDAPPLPVGRDPRPSPHRQRDPEEEGRPAQLRARVVCRSGGRRLISDH